MWARRDFFATKRRRRSNGQNFKGGLRLDHTHHAPRRTCNSKLTVSRLRPDPKPFLFISKRYLYGTKKPSAEKPSRPLLSRSHASTPHAHTRAVCTGVRMRRNTTLSEQSSILPDCQRAASTAAPPHAPAFAALLYSISTPRPKLWAVQGHRAAQPRERAALERRRPHKDKVATESASPWPSGETGA